MILCARNLPVKKKIDGLEIVLLTSFHYTTITGHCSICSRRRNSFLTFSEISKHSWRSVTFSKVAGLSFGDSTQNGEIKYENSVVKPVSILKISLLITFVARVLSKFV